MERMFRRRFLFSGPSADLASTVADIFSRRNRPRVYALGARESLRVNVRDSMACSSGMGFYFVAHRTIYTVDIACGSCDVARKQLQIRLVWEPVRQ
jgi:hypothetical protein